MDIGVSAELSLDSGRECNPAQQNRMKMLAQTTSFAWDGDDLTELQKYPNQCPVASFEKGMEMNLRAGPKCSAGHSEGCCAAIQRARDAARRAEQAIENNW